MSIESMMPSNHLIFCHPLLLPSVFPNIKVFSNDLALCIRWPKQWNFSFSISPSNEYQRLISFRMDWLDRPAVQGTLKSLLQQHNSKASILWHSSFFMVQLSHPFMILIFIFIYLFGCTRSQLQHSDLQLQHGNSVVACGIQFADRTWMPCIGSAESQPLDHWGR